MTTRILLTITCFCVLIELNAQTDFRPGYVIQLNGDSLIGEIDYRIDNILSSRCRFRKSATDSIQTFYPGTITGYRFYNSKYYVSKNIDGIDYFIEYLLQGAINLYSQQDDQWNTHYYIEKNGAPLIEIPYEEGIRYSETGKYTYATTKHIGILRYYMSETPQLYGKIERLRKPERKELLKLSEEYHNIVCDSVQCVIYEKRLPKFKINPQLVFGVTSLAKRYTTPNANSDLMYGLLCHFQSPYVSENLYIKTGFIYLPDRDWLSVPFYIEYMYPKGIVKPRFSTGFYLNTIKQHLGFSTGMNIVVSNKISLTIDYDTNFRNESEGEKIINYKFFFHSLYAGLRINI